MKNFILGFIICWLVHDTSIEVMTRLMEKQKLEKSVDLTGFDPKSSYPAYEGMPPVTSEVRNEQKEAISNLIVDMISKGVSTSELTRVVRHSMVIVDAEKHNLDYMQSARDNGIAQLKHKYQGV